MAHKTTRRGKRVLVIEFMYTKPDGTQGRYRRDAAVQTAAAAQTEEAARRMGATLFGNPEILCGPNGQPLKPVDAAPPPPPKEKEPTLAATIERYFAEYAPSALSPSTVEGYRGRLKVHIIPRFGTRPLSEAFEVARSREVDVAMIAAGLADSYRRGVFFALRSVAKFAVEAKLLPHLPAFMAPPTVGKRVPTAPKPGDVAAVIDAAPHPEWRLVILLAAHAGLRRGEILALRCSDCEIGRDRLVVRLSRYRWWQTGTPKSGHEREVPLTPPLRDALLAAGVDKRPGEECAALSTLGKPWSYASPYQVFQKTLRHLELPPERLHSLRAFFVTTLLRGHVPVHVVRELAGHANLATTQMYAAVVEGDRTSVVGVLERVYQGERATATTTSTGGQPEGASDAQQAPVRRQKAPGRGGARGGSGSFAAR